MKLTHRVLVLEDDDNALAGIVELLTECGYDVTPASAYEDAKRILSTTTYDLFLTDIRLRSYNGIHLVKKVREESPETAIIIMTGYDEPLMQLEASRYSAQFLKKPFKSADLLEAVSNDLWPAARGLAPELQRAACVLKANGARTVLLCGSGGSLAALWAHEGSAREAADQLGALAHAVVRTSRETGENPA